MRYPYRVMVRHAKLCPELTTVKLCKTWEEAQNVAISWTVMGYRTTTLRSDYGYV